MAPRPYWKGYLKVALVNCPVTLSPVTSDHRKIRFHTVNRETGNRVESRYVDSETGDPVEPEDEVKGYPIGEDKYVQLEEDELAAVALESTRTIDIDCFVPRPSIAWIWLDQPHFLAPDDKVGEEAFAVIREAMAATGTVGISRLVLQRRERAVMLEPRGKGIILWTLRYGDEVRDGGDVFEDTRGPKPEAKSLTMMKQLITAGETPWSADMVKDPVEARLAEIVAAKKKAAAKKPAGAARGRAKARHAPEENVVSIFDALRRSVESEKDR
jgi:DNA end-binding protein Ku